MLYSNGPQTAQEGNMLQGYLLPVPKKVHKWAQNPLFTVYGHEAIDVFFNFHENVLDLKQNTAVLC